MNALEEIAVQEGLFAARMVLQMAGLRFQLKAMQRHIEELEARLQKLEARERP